MSATDIDRQSTITDDQALGELSRVLGDVLDRASWLEYNESDPPDRARVDAALTFLAKTRAIVRAFEEGAQDLPGGTDWLGILNPDGDKWYKGARQWQGELDARAAMLIVEGRAS